MDDLTGSLATGPGLAALYRDIVENCADAVIVIDTEQKISLVNRSAERMFGYERVDIVGQPLDMLLPERLRSTHVRLVKKFHDSGTKAQFMSDRNASILAVRASGEEFPIEVSILRSGDAESENLVAIIRDETEQQRLRAGLERLAYIDQLTGALNRRSLLGRFEAELSRARRHELPLSIAMIDIDRFKRINDNFGHQVGDVALKNLTGLISAGLRKPDILGRWGGEEFIIVVPSTTVRGAEILAERIRHKVEQASFVPEGTDTPVSFTVSIGIAGLKPDDNSGDVLFADADRALYAAKDAGRNKVVVADATAEPYLSAVRAVPAA